MVNFSNFTNQTFYLANNDVDLIRIIIDLVVYSITALLGSILNLLLIFIWLINPIKKNYSNLLYISMAISDFILSVFVCLISFLYYSYFSKLIYQIIDKKLKNVTHAIDAAVTSISILSLFILSLHRYRQLSVPFKEKTEIDKIRTILIIAIWAICLIYWNAFNFYSSNYSSKNLIYCFSIGIFQFVPIFAIILLNILIIKEFILKIRNSKLNKVKFKRERKAIKCVLCISILLISLYSLYLIQFPVNMFGIKYSKYLIWISRIVNFYPALNPVIVFLFHNSFRKSLFNIYTTITAHQSSV